MILSMKGNIKKHNTNIEKELGQFDTDIVSGHHSWKGCESVHTPTQS